MPKISKERVPEAAGAAGDDESALAYRNALPGFRRAHPVLPSDLWDFVVAGWPFGPVALDTETLKQASMVRWRNEPTTARTQEVPFQTGPQAVEHPRHTRVRQTGPRHRLSHHPFRRQSVETMPRVFEGAKS